MPYHSQQVLLLRHEQEKHLDAVLKRKEKEGEQPTAFCNDVIRRHLDDLACKQNKLANVLFILVATPVEEVGRDHDFDWAIIEPSSYRSIVQLAGRVMRHRTEEVKNTNVGILQYNWKTVRSGDKEDSCYFTHPGYEFSGNIEINGRSRPAICVTHNLRKLINEADISKCLDAIPRIDENPPTGFGLARLEHAVTAHWLKRYDTKGPETLQGYVNQHWYLTGLPQALNRFRQSRASIQLYRCFDKTGRSYFTAKNDQDKPVYTIDDNMVNQDDLYRITSFQLSPDSQQRLWITRDYHELLAHQSHKRNLSMNSAALLFGEVVIQEPYENQQPPDYLYNDQLGLFKNTKGDKYV